MEFGTRLRYAAPAMNDARLILVTCPADAAEALARTLVEARVAACVNCVPGLLLIKTTRDAFEALRAAVLSAHPYELPELIAVDIDDGHPPYLQWITESLQR